MEGFDGEKYHRFMDITEEIRYKAKVRIDESFDNIERIVESASPKIDREAETIRKSIIRLANEGDLRDFFPDEFIAYTTNVALNRLDRIRLRRLALLLKGIDIAEGHPIIDKLRDFYGEFQFPPLP